MRDASQVVGAATSLRRRECSGDVNDSVPVVRYLQTPLSAALRAPLINRSLGHCVIPAPRDQPIVGAKVKSEGRSACC